MLVAVGLVARGSPASHASTDVVVSTQYILAAGDINCATDEFSLGHVSDNACQSGDVASMWDPNASSGAGYFTQQNAGQDPERIVSVGDNQYDNGWSDAYNYSGGKSPCSGNRTPYTSCDTATRCPGGTVAGAPTVTHNGTTFNGTADGACSFKNTWWAAASNNTSLSALTNNGVVAEAGYHDWQENVPLPKVCGGAGQPTCNYDSDLNSATANYTETIGGQTRQAFGYQDFFGYNETGTPVMSDTTYSNFQNGWGSFVEKVPCTGTGCTPLVLVFVASGACNANNAGTGTKPCDDSGAVGNWLATVLAGTKNPGNAFTVVVNYDARWGDFDHGDADVPENGVWHAMFKYNVSTNPYGYDGTNAQRPDLVIGGHNHGYERTVPIDKNGAIASVSGLPGIPQITVGTGGADTSAQTPATSQNFAPHSSAFAFDYFSSYTNSTTYTIANETADPGVVSIEWCQSGGCTGKWEAQHWYIHDDNGGTAGTPQTPNVGDDTGWVAVN
jgi:hypothetical protein